MRFTGKRRNGRNWGKKKRDGTGREGEGKRVGKEET
jgi:hypothetical protein